MTESVQEPESRFSEFKKLVREYPWDFMGFLFLALLIPRIYDLTNTFWIGHIDYSSLAIAEQYEFMGILIEIVNETIPFGVLALVSQNYSSQTARCRTNASTCPLKRSCHHYSNQYGKLCFTHWYSS